MRSPTVRRCKPSAARAAAEQGASNVPRLLKADAPVTIDGASSLDYDSRTGICRVLGRQVHASAGADTSITGDRLVIDQTKGDLSATGNAVSRLMLDNKITTSRAHEIRYSDERRLIVYSSAPKTRRAEVFLDSGPESTLRAGSVEITLAAKENTLEKMQAMKNVRVMRRQQYGDRRRHARLHRGG